MDFAELIRSGRTALGDGSVYERIRRDPAVVVDPFIFHGGLIYDPQFAPVLAGIHREYIDVSRRAGLPMLALTDTWRAGADRVARSAHRDRDVNADNARFLKGIAAEYGSDGPPVFVGGLIGPKGDAYKPEEAPPEEEAFDFHRPQIDGLVRGGVDFLVAMTFPALPEAVGIARALARTGKPYLVSFVMRRTGTLLDGTPLGAAIARIDAAAAPLPAGYGVNCVHPTVLGQALDGAERLSPGISRRIVSFNANTSALEPEELDGAAELKTESPALLAAAIGEVRRKFGLPVIGGCCGTGTEHLAAMARVL